MQQWKLDRITQIQDEVRELHPLLRQVFAADQSITSFEYTHGNTEMGADFVLARPDPTLGEEQYVGIIVKCGGIKQNFEDIRRQIDECKVERYFSGGKKKIYLSEIWILTNGSISNGAERKIFEDYKSKNIRFIDGDKLAKLVDKHASHFWNFVPENLAVYLAGTHAELSASETQMSLLPAISVKQYIEQDLIALERHDLRKVRTRPKSTQRLKLIAAIQKEKVTLIEGRMGSGKSSLFRRTAISLCTVDDFAKHKMIPKIIKLNEVVSTKPSETADAIAKIFDAMNVTAKDFNEPVLQILFVDAVDEVACDVDTRLKLIKSIADIANSREDVRVVFGCREIWGVDEEIDLDRFLARFTLCQLTPNQMVQFLEEVCKSLNLTARFKDELTRSNIFKVLPKTPMSTVLLAKIMNAGLKELPQTLPELYSKYTELALGRWDAAKGLATEKEYPLLENLVHQLAEYMLDNNLDSMNLDEVKQRFSQYLDAREDVPTAEDVISKLSQRTELLAVSKEENVFRFRHKTFLEFFYASQQKEKLGKSAPLNNPFDGYWLGVEYFYLGLIQDAGTRINSISSLVIADERQLFLKIINFGNLLLAAHRTEYTHIEQGLYRLFLEITKHFEAVATGEVKSVFSDAPKLQFLAILSLNLRYVLGFDYFRKALETISIQLEVDGGISENQRILASFFVDSVRAGLKEKDVFKFLIEKSSADLDWVIRLGIQHVAMDEGIKSDALERFNKKLAKMRKGNGGLKVFIHDLYTTSMIDLRKKVPSS